MIRNIYQKNDIYPFGSPTLSRQIQGGEKKKRKDKKEKNKKVTMKEKKKKCLESTSKNKNGKN